MCGPNMRVRDTGAGGSDGSEIGWWDVGGHGMVWCGVVWYRVARAVWVGRAVAQWYFACGFLSVREREKVGAT